MKASQAFKKQLYIFAKRLKDFVRINILNSQSITRVLARPDSFELNSSSLLVMEQLHLERSRKAMQAYGRSGSAFFEQPVLKENLNWICRSLSSQLKHGARVLDVGCGIGVFGKFFAQPNSGMDSWQYCGVEISEGQVQLCRDFLPTGKFIVGDAKRLDFEDKSYDALLASGVLHCLHNDWRQALNEFYRVSRGWIGIMRLPLVQNHESFDYDLIFRSKSARSMQRMKILNQNEFEAYARQLGLQIESREVANESVMIEGFPKRIPMYRYLLKKL